MSRESNVVAIGVGIDVGRLFQRWVSASGDRILCFGFEPPCELAQARSARLVFVDGSTDPALGIAECGRLRVASRRLVLIANDVVAVQSAALRAGVTEVLQSPVLQGEFERCLSEQSSSCCDESGVRPAISGTPLGPTTVLDRLARTLWVDGREVAISAQKFDLLCYLLDRLGVAVCAAELVRDGLLRPSQAQRYKGLIRELRGALGSARCLIRTVPGYGYRLDTFPQPRASSVTTRSATFATSARTR